MAKIANYSLNIREMNDLPYSIVTDPIKSLSFGEIECKILREEVTKQGQSKRIENKEAKS